MRKLIAILALTVAACAAPVQEETATSNHEVSVGLLTTFDDCRVYRLNDAGRYIYITRCGDETKTASPTTYSCGKGCAKTVWHNADPFEAKP